MSNETEFVSGMYFKQPREGAPDYVVGKLSINRDKLLAWLTAKQPNEAGYINCDIKIGKSGKPYVAVDNWKGERGNHATSASQSNATQDESFDDSIPF